MKWIRVNMSDLSVKVEDVPKKYEQMGGRWLTSSVVADEVPATCHPLGPLNKVVIAPGILSGTTAPSSGRISVGTKSPLTGGIKEANAGTKVSQYLKRMGYSAIIIEGQPKNKESRYLLTVGKEKVELVDATEYKFMGLYELSEKLASKYGKDVGIASVGPAAEHLLAGTGVAFNDVENRPARYAGRGGVGAVFASKGLKAIVVEAVTGQANILNHELFETGRKKLLSALQEHAVTKPGGALNTYGTAVLVNIMNEAGALPTRNFSSGTFEGAKKISGEAMAEAAAKNPKAGMMGHRCHPGCVIGCSVIYPDAQGNSHTSVEYETLWAIGANCGIDDLDAIAQMNSMCNDIGLDTIEFGDAVAVAMEGGLLPFGDAKGAIALLEEVRKGSPLGKIIGSGCGTVGKVFGVRRVPAVKNQGMPAYEPRVVKGIGVTYITTPMGADHTAGYSIAPEILGVGGKFDPHTNEGKVKLSKDFQATTCFIDSTGCCVFTAFAILDIPSGFEGMVEACNAVTGANWTTSDAYNIGLNILNMEHQFNLSAGFTSNDDRPPEFMKLEPVPPHNMVWDMADSELDSIWK
ncbi:aldehyde ferredoxin oxidoreductase family protein [Thermodesulfobium sp.]